MLLSFSAAGAPITKDQQKVIKRAGVKIPEPVEVQRASLSEQDPSTYLPSARHTWLYEIPKVKYGEDKGKPFEGSCYWDKIPKAWHEKYRDVEIDRSMWRHPDPTHCSKEFYDFIDSHIPQFDNIIAYEPFYLYCEQARRWLEDKRTLSDIPPLERGAWKKRELWRIAQNKLYGLNKYVSIKEDGSMAGGRRKFEASAPHALVAFVVDLGKHFDLVKGRQAALTSEMLAIADLMMIVIPSFTGVFMVHKKDGTGKGLFRDKHQNTLQHLPPWIVKEIDVSKGFSSESTIIDFDRGDTKVTKGMDVSEFRLLSAEDSMAVNGKTPTISLFDEAQNIPTYQKIKGEIDPSLYQFNPDTGKMDLVRQIFAWGTGSSNNTGQGAFENDFKSLLDAWEKRENTEAWVPLFFDWTCRPGVSIEFYSKQRDKYLRGQTEETKGLSPAERLSLFNAHYPCKPDDAFMSSHKTLIPMEIISKQQQRIIQLCHKAEPSLMPKKGRFVPVFDTSVEIPGDSYFAHPVKSVIWQPARDDDFDAPVSMFIDHDPRYANRFFQGTDPIQNDGGFSRFSSVIWDAAARSVGEGDEQQFIPTVACVLNSRHHQPAELFIQCALMGMYYANYGQKACKELVEINVGHRYVDFKIGPIFNLRESLLTRGQLLPKYKSGSATNIYGLDLKGGKGSRKELLYADVVDLLLGNWHNIWYYDIWTQIRHVVVEDKGDKGTAWSTSNKNAYNDDMIYAMGYAELCCRCVGKQPEIVTSEHRRTYLKRILDRDSNKMPFYRYEEVPVSYA